MSHLNDNLFQNIHHIISPVKYDKKDNVLRPKEIYTTDEKVRIAEEDILKNRDV